MRLSARHSPVDAAHVSQDRILQIGRELLERARKRQTTSLWRDKLIDWAMRDPAFKTQLFRFIDVFPTLSHPQQVHDILLDYLTQPGVQRPAGLDLALKAGGLMQGTLAKTISSQIEAMAKRFIVGNDANAAIPILKQRWQQHLAFSLDLLGEACVSQVEAQQYQARYLELMHTLPERIADWPTDDLLECDHLGPLPRANISVKVSSLCSDIKSEDFAGSVDRLFHTLKPILETAKRRDVFVNFDMEHHELKDITIALFMCCCEQIDFHAGLALQAYLQSADDDAQKLVAWSKQLGRSVTVRLVKGAYWDYERIHAERMNWPSPVWPTKGATDACFERLTRVLLDATPTQSAQGGIKLALGSHNARSIAYALAHVEARDLPRSAIELQMIFGMAEALKLAAVSMNCRVREYLPVGEMIPGMAYLVRRLLENTSNESWLKAGFNDDRPMDELLASPEYQDKQTPFNEPGRHALSSVTSGVAEGKPFMSEPCRDFTDTSQRQAFAHAIKNVSLDTIPNDLAQADLDHAMAVAGKHAHDWATMPACERSSRLIDAASRMRDRRDELSGLIIREAGKPWREADAEVCEAIDFLEFYARESAALFEPKRLGQFVGEHNEHRHHPRGIAAIISPWNFPLAITAGMAVAALSTGNTVIIKPAEQTPYMAQQLCEILWQAGVPRGVLHFIPGQGETLGATLVRDPRIALIAFTGSKAVGLDILRAANQVHPSQRFVKKVVCEMGGKNAIIVDSTADLDEAVIGVRQSAFSFSGQKCSACSRVIVLDDVYDRFVDRLVESTRILQVGDPLDPATDVGPMIDEEAANKALRYIEIGKQEGTLVLYKETPGTIRGKPLISPCIMTNIEMNHRLANEEVFGPVLAVMRAKDFDEALHIANRTDYKLTGGLYSRHPTHIEHARRAFLVGNLYLNRSITGAWVARQPFGGFGLSGTGTKAGGRAYLANFVESRIVCENTLRRGFAPQEG